MYAGNAVLGDGQVLRALVATDSPRLAAEGFSRVGGRRLLSSLQARETPHVPRKSEVVSSPLCATQRQGPT